MGQPDHEKLAELYTLLEFKSWFEENQRDAKRAGQEIVEVAEEQPGAAEARYEVILDQARFDAWLAKLEQAPLFAFVTVTKGIDVQHSQLDRNSTRLNSSH